MHTSLSFGMLNQLHHSSTTCTNHISKITEPIHTFKLNPSIQHQLRFILWNFLSLFQPTNAFGALKTYVRPDLTFHFATSFMNPFLTPCSEYGVVSDSFTTNTTRIFA